MRGIPRKAADQIKSLQISLSSTALSLHRFDPMISARSSHAILPSSLPDSANAPALSLRQNLALSTWDIAYVWA